jgi:murein DD-endopeptidase MepM/ murein hydrolase activator NlpD
VVTDPPHVRRPLVPAALVALLAALPAYAQAQSTGGVQYAPLNAPSFTITPATLAPGAPLTVRYQINAAVRRVRVRVDLLPETGGAPQATLSLGRKRTGREYTATWRPRLEPGRYAARLRATTLRRDGRARISTTSTIEIQGTTPVSARPGVFPVQGPYSLGGAEARFGAPREGHAHQGQDIMADKGTPVVAPRAGFIAWRAFQAEGAGYYLVLHGDDNRDYVFMHLQSGSLVVQKGDGVIAGQRLGAVGETGHADGPHLHFEIWPSGWYSSKRSQPIDPLPDLLAWAA